MKKVSAQMKRGAWILAATSLVLVAGCSGTKRKLAADLPTINTAINLEQAWSISLGKSDPYTFRPVAIGDELLAASAGGNIYRVVCGIRWPLFCSSTGSCVFFRNGPGR